MLTLHNKTKYSMLDIHQSREGQSFISVIYSPYSNTISMRCFFKIQCKIIQIKNKIIIENSLNGIPSNKTMAFLSSDSRLEVHVK